MINLVKSELYKIKFERSIWIILLMVLAISVNNFGLQTSSSGKEALMSSTRDFVTLFACATYAGMSIGNDFSKRTINKVIISGHTRFTVMLSKLIHFYFGCTIIYFSTAFLITIPYALTKGWGTNLTEVKAVFVYLILTLFFTLCTSTIMFLIAFIIKETGVATAICIFAMLVFILSIKDSSFAATTMAINFINGNGSIIIGILFGIVQMILGIVLSYIHFKKVELK
ncbi:hypothetical protein WL278_12445 [Staphylococcus caprae]|uniref:hypothetical protein n=1 Tax=Staphylococcus TaxID=1279 RepID=UPI0008A9BBD6|nr:hypothetical protein [Staphylococcus sp. HMSC62A08]OHS39875.1 hypothetical protein HMPREF3264_03555 [Staphylococcus sp. HMSC62A08]